MQELGRKVQFANMLFNGDNDHIYSRFTIGNTNSLQKPDIISKLYDFYQHFYAKNKLRVVTVCNKDHKAEIERVIGRKDVNIPSYRPGQKKLSAPNIRKNRFILVKGETSDSLLITKYLDIDLEEFGYLGFVTSILDNVLTKVLIEEQTLVDSFTTAQEYSKEFAEIEINIDLSLKGKKRLEETLDIVFGVLNSLDTLFNQEVFDDVKNQAKKAYKLLSKPSQSYDFVEGLLQNYLLYGFEKMEGGSTIINLKFDKQKIVDVWKKMKTAKSIIIFTGKLRSTKKKGADFKPGINLEKSQKLGNLGEKYNQKDVLKRRLTDYSYLGIKRTNGKPQQHGVIELDFYHPEYQLEAGYLDLNNDFEKMKKKGIKYTPNPFKMSDETLKSASQTPTNLIKELSVSPLFYSRLNTKYPLFSVGIYIDFYVDGPLSPEVNANLVILEIILRRRFQLTNERLSTYESVISSSTSPGMLTLAIGTTHDNLKPIIKILREKLLNGRNKKKIWITRDEKKYALDDYYTSLQNKVPIMSYSQEVLKRFLKSKVTLTRSQTMKYLRKLDKVGIPVPKFKVGRIYTEGYVNDNVNNFVVNELVTKLDPSFSHKTKFDYKKYDYITEGFKKGKTVVLGMAPMIKDDKNKVYAHLFRTDQKKSNEKFYACALVLKSILYNSAFAYLRTKKQLGYVVDAGIIYSNKEIFMMIFVQTTDVNRARPEVENFYRLAETELGELTDEKVKGLTQNVISQLRSPYSSVYEESADNHSNLREGINPDYDARVATYLEEGHVKKATLMNTFKDVFQGKISQKIIVDSSLKPGPQKYGVGGNQYIHGEEFAVQFFED